MLGWFNRTMRGIQILFLLIPIANIVFEIGIRWSKFADHPNFGYFLLALFATLGGFSVLILLDIIWCLFFHHMILAVADDEVY